MGRKFFSMLEATIAEKIVASFVNSEILTNEDFLLEINIAVQIFSSSLSLECALRESGCRIGYEPTKMS